jgi:peptide/nickel transport system substrate-binding protein
MANAAGFGPYQLDSGVPNKTATLSPNPGFWGEKAPYKKLIQQGVNEQGARLQLVLTNNAQYAGELTPLQLEQAGKGKVNVTSFTTARIAFLVLDARVKPFDDPKVRQAIARAIPYDEIIKTVYRGFAQPWRSAFPPWFQGSTDEFWDYETDSAAAKSVLETVGGEPLKLYYYKNFGSGQQISVIVQQALKEAGLDVEIEGLLQAVAEKRKLAGELPFFVDDSDSPSIPHPLYALNLMYTSTAFQNMAHYSNKEIDAIAAKLAQTPEIEAQNTLVKQANEILMNDLPYIPIAYTGTTGVNQKSLTGIGGQLTSLVDYGRFRPA